MSQRSPRSAALLAVLLCAPGCTRPYLIESRLLAEAEREPPAIQGKLAVEAWPMNAGQARFLRYAKVRRDLEGGRTAPGWTAVRAPPAGRPLLVAGSVLVGVAATLLALGLPMRGVTVTYYSGFDNKGELITNPIGVPISNWLFALSGATFGAGVPMLITGLINDPLVKPGTRGWVYLPQRLPRD